MNGFARVVAVTATVVLAACGGAMEAGVGSGGSGAPLSVGVGSVTGFGSIIVNGERYDETAAEVLVDQRPDRPDAATVAAIHLGTHVELQHRNLVIARVTASSELIGPVASFDAAGFVALGQTVRVNGDAAHATAFDGFDALSDLAAGAVVEVHGDRVPSGEILATRVELKPTGVAVVRLAGTVAAVSGRSFSIGALSVDASSASLLPVGTTLAAGQRVVAWTDVPYSGGPLVAKIVRVDTPTIVENTDMTLDGVVADFRGPSSFRVGGVLVNADSAVFTGGAAADLANGRSVRVSGAFAKGVLNATTVEIQPAVPTSVQLTGAITDFVDVGSLFRVRDSLVRVSAQTTYVGGTATNLGTGVQVKAAGPLVDGVVQALSVEFLPLPPGLQQVVVGRVTAPVGAPAADGSRTFRLDGAATDVRATAATAYRNGVAADIAIGRQLKVTGSVQGTLFVADEVQFLDNPSIPPNVEIDGIAGKVQSTSLVVNGETVQLIATTLYTLNGVPTTIATLRNGVQVQVLATRISGPLTALSVEIRSAESVASTVRGIVNGRTPANATAFLVGSQRVNVAAGPTVLPASKSLADVVNGADVEVQGTLANGVLNATRIKLR
ncbi:MAG TPA: DUF5666 domain-containing protein [Ilumatobacteraceae bacterium]|nr:DUF5666 domain-containing protein [Ilumatobacteraceae bacterium]